MFAFRYINLHPSPDVALKQVNEHLALYASQRAIHFPLRNLPRWWHLENICASHCTPRKSCKCANKKRKYPLPICLSVCDDLWQKECVIKFRFYSPCKHLWMLFRIHPSRQNDETKFSYSMHSGKCAVVPPLSIPNHCPHWPKGTKPSIKSDRPVGIDQRSQRYQNRRFGWRASVQYPRRGRLNLTQL